tara:strand:+ start:6625 stop:7884 length:1260 start_codon:yes stop_codon:yes gene_type:complete
MAKDTQIGGMSVEKLNYIDKFLQENYLDTNKLNGFVTGIFRKRKVVHSSALGFMDKELKKPMNLDTIFRIYSMTKPITSVALMQLYEKGLFQLDDPVSKYIEEFDNLKVYVSGDQKHFVTQDTIRRMTIHDLLTHQAGFTYGLTRITEVDAAYQDLGLVFSDAPMQEKIKLLTQLPLEFQPGSHWNYSVATDVCGYLIELLSGKSLDQYFLDEIFDPLNMVDTSFHVSDSKIDRLATNYEFQPFGPPIRTDNPIYGNFTSPPQFLSGGAGLLSTFDDYLHFCQMILNKGIYKGNRILSRKTIELMSQNHLIDKTDPNSQLLWSNSDLRERGFSGGSDDRYFWNQGGVGFGLGFSVLINPANSQSSGSVGELSWGGWASTTFWIDPIEDLIVIFLTQLLPSDSYNVRKELKSLVYSAIED